MPVIDHPPPDVPPTVVEIIIDFDGSIYWDNNKVEDVETLKSYLTAEANRVPKSELHLKPNKLAKYDMVAKVLATAQRLGVTNIGIVGNEALE
jgi:biopolymer transport protein ExbD